MTTVTETRPTLPSISEKLLELFGPWFFAASRAGDSEEERLRKASLMGGSIMILPVAVVWALLYAAFREWPAALITSGYALIDLLIIVLLYRSGRRRPLAFVQVLCTLLLPFVLTLALGGLGQSSALIIGAFMAPLGALLYHDAAAAGWVFAGFVLLVIITSALNPMFVRVNNLPIWLILAFFALNVIIVTALAFFQMRAFINQRDAALRLLRVEQEKTDSLLCNILPRSIADVLKESPQTIAERYEAVTILFADVVGFTSLSAATEPTEMVNLLNEIYTCFDDVVEQFGLEKIRTMGDGYMAIAGAPRRRDDHAQATAAAALEMMAFLRRWESPHAADIQFRMGINSGPVLAGVIGRKKFSYDVWGDPVNVASRMESRGEPGKIQVSRDTYELLKDEFELAYRGVIPVKGKGTMETWYLLGRKGEIGA